MLQASTASRLVVSFLRNAWQGTNQNWDCQRGTSLSTLWFHGREGGTAPASRLTPHYARGKHMHVQTVNKYTHGDNTAYPVSVLRGYLCAIDVMFGEHIIKVLQWDLQMGAELLPHIP
eukprot:5422190-Lingulodinium_polyedra.AAC.1